MVRFKKNKENSQKVWHPPCSDKPKYLVYPLVDRESPLFHYKYDNLHKFTDNPFP